MMQQGKITSTPTPRVRSALPAIPQVPLLLHPHKPLLFTAHGRCMRLFDYETQQWVMDELQTSSSPQQPSNVYLPVSEKNNPLTADDENLQQHQNQHQHQRHTMDVSAADCVCLACGCRSSDSPVQARAPCVSDYNNRNSNSSNNSNSSKSSNCLWVTAGDDKFVCLWGDESFELLQRRLQRKKTSAVCFLPSNQPHQKQQRQQQKNENIVDVLVCDKFGDIFLLPLDSLDGHQRLAGDVVFHQMQTTNDREKQSLKENSDKSKVNKTIKSQETGNVLDCMNAEKDIRKDDKCHSSDDDDETDVPVLAHLTTVTCLKLVSAKHQQKRKHILITGDRDEKIRVAYSDCLWKLEAAHLGHRDFITDVAVLFETGNNDNSRSLPDAVASGSNSNNSSNNNNNNKKQEAQVFIISASGDCSLRAWRMEDGRLHPKGFVSLNPRILFKNQLKNVTPYLEQQQQYQQEHQVQEEEEKNKPAVLTGHLLPVKIYADEMQQLLVLQILQLKGLLLIPYRARALREYQEPEQQRERENDVYGEPKVLPLDYLVGTFMITRHGRDEIENLTIFKPIKMQMQMQMQHQEKLEKLQSLLIAWIVDVEGQLQAPVCLELSLLMDQQHNQEQKQLEQQRQDDTQNAFLPLLQGIKPPTVIENQSNQKQKTCYWWKSIRDPDALTPDERRSKRLRHKHLQQQQQMQQMQPNKKQ